jgi:DNA invertase Pin-like site-specific DNA recombinase
MTDPIRAAVYCRISLAELDDTTKVDEQEEKCRAVARARGWDVAQVFTDNSRSAWQRNRKRPAWDAMLADIGAGRLDAVVSYWGDRIVRQPRDLEDLLDLRDGRRLRLASVAGQYDFDNPDHRMMMRWEVARACHESDTISRRVTDHNATRRAQGLTRSGGRGGRAFGFATDGVTHLPAYWCELATRREVSEADVIREVAARILAGESRGSICRDLAARGWETTAGNVMSHTSMLAMITRPRVAGLMPDGETRAAWEPVLGRDVWEQVRLVLDARSGSFAGATNTRRWLLSGIAVCGPCGRPVQIQPAHGRLKATYQCRRADCGKVVRSAAQLDAYVSGAVHGLLNEPRNPAPTETDDGHAAEWVALGGERAETEQLLEDYKASAGRTRLLLARLDRIDARIEELRSLAGTSAQDRLLGRYRGITLEEFLALPLDVRRSLVAGAVTVTVLPASGRGPGFRTQDVRVKGI